MVKNGRSKRRNHKLTKPPRPSKPSAQEVKPTTAKTLPADLLLEILYRTPVKSLVRFKCVSKSWLALIHHPTFIEMHLNFNTSRNTQLICNSSKLVAFLSLTQPPIPVLHIDRHFTTRPNYPRKINFPDFSKNMVLAGSINGIVCLAHYKEMSRRFVALWNPATNHWNPISLAESKSWHDMSVGFGFDAVTNDYKIICIVPETRFEDIGRSRVVIYSTNQGSWEAIDKQGIIPFYPKTDLGHCNFIVKGVPYWVGYDIQLGVAELSILGRIDPCTGLYKKVMHPKHVKNKSTRVNPVKLRDSVAALIQSPGEYPNLMVDLYLLDESTAKWTKMYSIGPLVFERLLEQLWIPQCFSTGEIVLETWTMNNDHVTDLVCYFCDPRTNLVLCNKLTMNLRRLNRIGMSPTVT